jgi:hypothetical protein
LDTLRKSTYVITFWKIASQGVYKWLEYISDDPEIWNEEIALSENSIFYIVDDNGNYKIKVLKIVNDQIVVEAKFDMPSSVEQGEWEDLRIIWQDTVVAFRFEDTVYFIVIRGRQVEKITI